MKISKILILLILLSISILAQKTQQQIEEEQRRLDKERQRKLEAQDGRKMGELSPEIFVTKKKDANLLPWLTAIYPTSEQKKLLRPSDDDFARYSAFLKQEHTGLIRIFAHADCLPNPHRNVIKADDPCMNEVPLSGYYSFRKKDYSLKHLSDLRLNTDTFYTDGGFANGIIVSLGDIPIESVSLESNGMQLLDEFPPARKWEEISPKSKQLNDGIKIGDYFYSGSAVAAENTTYALRVIAYRSPFDYYTDRRNPYSRDKREDIIVAFREVRKDTEGNLTLLWKELQRKHSPKMKIPRNHLNGLIE